MFQDVDIDGQSYTMAGLKKNTEYSFRVVANNKHGPGVSTEDVIVRTLSDGQFIIWMENLDFRAIYAACIVQVV